MRDWIALFDWIKLVLLMAALGSMHAAAAAATTASVATVVATPAVLDQCVELSGCERLTVAASPAVAQGAVEVAAPSRSPLELTFSGYAYHFRQTRCKHCERTDVVPGIGMQYRLYGNESVPWRVRLAAGVQYDSFRHLGYYAGITGQRVYRAGWGELEYGIGAFALRRTFSSKGGLEWMLTPLPVFSVRPNDSRWGLNVLAAPNFQHDGKRRSGFVFFQLSYALGS